MITQYEIRQELHSASPLIGESRLIMGPFDSKEEAFSEAAKSPLRHLFIVGKNYASENDLRNHFWSEIRMIPLEKRRIIAMDNYASMGKDSQMRVDSVFYDDFFEDPSIYWAMVAQNDRVTYVPVDAKAIEDQLLGVNLSTDEGYQKLCDVCLSCLKEKGFSLYDLPQIEEASPALQYVFNDFWSTENDNYFIEQDDGAWDEIGISKEEFIRQIDQDIEKFNLQEAIVADSDDALFSVYPDLLAAFSTKTEEKSQCVDRDNANKMKPSKEKDLAVR